MLPGYDPDPYDHLAASYRDAGHDDRADTVLLAKQRHRHTGYGHAGRIWGWLQEWTVGYGYRPWRAALWLAVCWLLGSLWFTYHQLPRLDSGQDPSWQPVIYAANLLVPVVNLTNYWPDAPPPPADSGRARSVALAAAGAGD